MQPSSPDHWHGTTILTVRKQGSVVIGGDGQVSIGQTVVKANAKKVRRLGKGDVIGGFAGATADAFTLFERLEAKLEQYPGQLTRAAVELAKDWRTDRYLRRLEAMMIVADAQVSLILTGTGDVLEPEGGVMGIGEVEPGAFESKVPVERIETNGALQSGLSNGNLNFPRRSRETFQHGGFGPGQINLPARVPRPPVQ